MRIAWISNAPWVSTGYGTQTKQAVSQIFSNGHDVAIMSNYGLNGTDMSFGGVTVMGGGYHVYSNDLAPSQVKDWLGDWKKNTGIAITLYDVWVYIQNDWATMPVASWVPIDHKIAPKGVVSWFTGSDMRWPIAMSKFGYRELINAGIQEQDIMYVPHAIDTSVFTKRKTPARQILGVPENAHLTFINAMNKGYRPIRKCFPEMLTAWCNFAKNKKDAYLYMHTDVFGMANGMNLVSFVDDIGWKEKGRIIVTPTLDYRRGLTEEGMVDLYNASDVLLMTSRGEGFGIPAIEAQACGVPVIVTDWTAQTELCGSGWLINGQEEWDAEQTGWWKVPNVEEIQDALEQSYKSSKSVKISSKMSNQAVKFASGYDSTYVYNKYWKPVLKDLEDRVAKLK